MKKIIILTSERSGTNLLRVLLGKHKHISAPVAPHFFDSFSQYLHNYSNLKHHKNLVLLLDHMIRLANHYYHDWKLNIKAEELIEK